MSEFIQNVEAATGTDQFDSLFESIMTIPDDSMTPEFMSIYTNTLDNLLNDEVKASVVERTVAECHNEGLTAGEFRNRIQNIKRAFVDYIDALQPSQNKRTLLEHVCGIINSYLEASLAAYNAPDFEMQVSLDEGAQVPTYAHETDAAADLYAADTVVIPAHSRSTMVRTGVHIALPEHWMALILPRSSIGAKTPLRLSNSMGVIDTEYRGQLGVLYDNISDSDYTITKGDRIAQLLVMPSHSFKPVVVAELNETDRGEGGFGSTGV